MKVQCVTSARRKAAEEENHYYSSLMTGSFKVVSERLGSRDRAQMQLNICSCIRAFGQVIDMFVDIQIKFK
jgi:hypothetical protein